ncbi:MAG: outer membrane protein assembly factor BamE [Oxalicibacterium faecigallinarum]|uniref:outer membrane protein assembly factor BamE n=1 Tax=Oxalicibacterium faecigallinarum TaxID=573741 RepID=UPI0028090FF7|nr:outer membrane protein assembly factor BamE [Oxalicibacterium faecigallinarum]MDQ7969457.1 outer membrane protein assembly factor BamE [Oxalicibacterium faecigallinarum]
MKRFLAGLSGFLCSLLMFGCNQHGRPIEDFGIEKLTKGVSTEADVRQAMGEPEMVWNEPSGARTFEYPKGPEGHRTWMVELDAGGIMRDYRQTLTDENFARVQAGMTRDDVRRLLGKPGSIATFPLKNEEVWDWRYFSGSATERFFHVHFDRDSGKVVRMSSSDPVKG